MSLLALTLPFPWTRYSRKLAAKIDNPRNVGFFSASDAASREMGLVEGADGSLEEGNLVQFYWLVDQTDGVIVDAKFQLFGQSALIGAADAACDLLVGKNHDQAKRLTSELIDKQVRDKSEDSAFPKETFPHLNLVISAVLDAAEKCAGIPVSESYIAPPVPSGTAVEGDGYPGWDELSHEKKVAIIEDVLDREVRPYIALDAGGIELVSLSPRREILVSYQGSCTSCYSSVGATLSYIQQVLRAKVHPEVVVVPNFDTPPTGAPPWA